MAFKGIFISAMFLFVASSPKQDEITISGNFNAAVTDGEGRIYAINSKLTLQKFSNQGLLLRSISVVNHGSDPVLDASNPLEIFAYFGSTGKAVWFDNQLNEQSSLELFGLSISKPVAFGRANDGLLWVFDDNSKTLKKLGRNGSLINESIVLSGYRPSTTTVPVFDDGNNIVFNDAQKNVYIFDRNLVLLKTDIKSMTALGIQSGTITGETNGYLVSQKVSDDAVAEKEILWGPLQSKQIISLSGQHLLCKDSAGLQLINLAIDK